MGVGRGAWLCDGRCTLNVVTTRLDETDASSALCSDVWLLLSSTFGGAGIVAFTWRRTENAECGDRFGTISAREQNDRRVWCSMCQCVVVRLHRALPCNEA